MWHMARKVFLGIRIDPELKTILEEIGEAETRSVSQISEFLLKKGVDAYKKEGPNYFRRSTLHVKKRNSD
jgi:hypothetical protein